MESWRTPWLAGWGVEATAKDVVLVGLLSYSNVAEASALPFNNLLLAMGKTRRTTGVPAGKGRRVGVDLSEAHGRRGPRFARIRRLTHPADPAR